MPTQHTQNFDGPIIAAQADSTYAQRFHTLAFLLIAFIAMLTAVNFKSWKQSETHTP